MTADAFRRRMDEFWSSVNREAEEAKDPHLALDRLHALYRSFDPEECQLGDRVLADWVLSDVEAKRFDAVALIREFRIASAAPALRSLVERLEASADPGAPFEREKIEGLLTHLAETSGYDRPS